MYRWNQHNCQQPLACRPCCCPAYCICCIRHTTVTAPAATPTTPATPTTTSVTYNAGGGTGGTTDANVTPQADYVIRTDEEAGVERQGYTFTGWNTAADGSGTAYQPGETINPQEDTTLYAQWTPAPRYSVTYNANGGTGEYTDPDIAEDSPYTVKTLAQTGIAREGYTFTGWNTAADGSGTEYQPGAELTVNGDTTLYAQWTAQ